MSKTGYALLIKFAMTFIFAGLAFALITANAWSWILLAGLVATAVNYLVGDLWVLPNFGNIAASVGDGILGALVAYIIDLLVPAFQTGAAALVVFALLIMVGEYFFHQYLLRTEKVAP